MTPSKVAFARSLSTPSANRDPARGHVSPSGPGRAKTCVVRLICTLQCELEIDRETLPVVLSLVDQLYDTRQRLLSLTAAVAAQDKTVQAAIITALEPDGGDTTQTLRRL